MRIVFAGTPAFASAALNAIIAAGFNVIAAYTQPDRPSGRGMKLTASPVKLVAQQHNIPVLQPASLKPVDAQAALADLQPDVIVVAAYGLILPQAVLEIPRLGCLNIHASLLPRWRGAAPIHRAILAGDTESGVAIMQMEAGLDTGPVLLERRTPIAPNDTTGSLHDRLAALGAEAIVTVLVSLQRGEMPMAHAQPSEGVTYAHKISPDEARIDWAQNADHIERQVRAFNPAPGASTTWRGEPLKIWNARTVDRLPDDTAAHQTLAAGSIIVSASGCFWN
jgi:methionyl-tRNA formyltransferase